MKAYQSLKRVLLRFIESDPSNLDISLRSKLFLYGFLYTGIIFSGYAAARAGNLADYGGGRWFYYSEKILKGEIPFLDFTLDQGPLLAYLFAWLFSILGQNLFALQLELNLIFPLFAFILYHVISLETFRDYRFRYGFLCMAWILNLSYLPSIPAIAVPAGILSVILLVKGWKWGNYYRLIGSGIISALLIYTDPYIGVCVFVTNIFIIATVFLFIDIPFNRRFLKFLILFISFCVGIAFFNLIFYHSDATANYSAHFKALYLDSWVWYLGTPFSSHIIYGLFFLIFFTHLSIHYFRVDRQRDKFSRFLPLFAMSVFSFLSFYSLFYQSNSHHFFTWFPTIFTFFFLLMERYFILAIPHAFNASAFRLRLSSLLPKLRSFQLLGNENFAIISAMIFFPLLLFLFVVGPYSIHRTSVSKYFITSFTSVKDSEGNKSVDHMRFNKKEGVWMKNTDLIYLERLEDYLKLNVRLYEEAVFLPQTLYGSIAGFPNTSRFYSFENTFLREYRVKLLERWQHFKPAYVVIDTKDNYVHYSEDYLLQNFESFIEENYIFETQINRYILLKRKDSLQAKSPYKSLNSEKANYPRSTLLLKSNAIFPLSPVAAIDITYTYPEPMGVPSFLYRPFLKLVYYRGEKKVAVKHFTVPYTSKALKVRIKLRDQYVSADRITVRIAERSYAPLKPRKADLKSLEVFTLKPGFQSFSGISVQQKE